MIFESLFSRKTLLFRLCLGRVFYVLLHKLTSDDADAAARLRTHAGITEKG